MQLTLFEPMAKRTSKWIDGLTPERVHLCDLRALEARLFGYQADGVAYTLHDFFHDARHSLGVPCH